MNIPEDLKYAKSHEWVKMLDEETALIGLTDYAPVSYTHLTLPTN